MKKISDKLIEFFEQELNNEESRSRIKRNILEPSLTLLKDEIDRSGTNDYLTTFMHHLMWPMICILIVTMVLCILMIFLQIYILVR